MSMFNTHLIPGLDDLVIAQGWNESTLGGIAVAFIAQRPHFREEFIRYAGSVAAGERYALDAEESIVPGDAIEPEARHRQDEALSTPEGVIADLVDQLDAIGIPQWHGAEGLSLQAARDFISDEATQQRGAQRERQAELDAISWNDEEWPYTDWQEEVARGDTRRSYAQWVLDNREVADEEGAAAPVRD